MSFRQSLRWMLLRTVSKPAFWLPVTGSCGYLRVTNWCPWLTTTWPLRWHHRPDKMEFSSAPAWSGGVLPEHGRAALFSLVTQGKLQCQLVHILTSWNEHAEATCLRGRRSAGLLSSEALVLPPHPLHLPRWAKATWFLWALLSRVFWAQSEQGTTQMFSFRNRSQSLGPLLISIEFPEPTVFRFSFLTPLPRPPAFLIFLCH